MTEPIKLPPLGRAAGIWAPAYGENEVRNYMRLAVESATGDLRAELTAHKRLNKDLETESVKAFAERDEARAEVERLREAFYESLVPELQELRDQNRDLRAEVERLRAAFHESQARELAALQELDEARAEVERLRMQVVACGVVALADTPDSAIEARKMHPDYRSDSLSDVERRVDECIRLRAEVKRLRAVLERAAECGLRDEIHAALKETK